MERSDWPEDDEQSLLPFMSHLSLLPSLLGWRTLVDFVALFFIVLMPVAAFFRGSLRSADKLLMILHGGYALTQASLVFYICGPICRWIYESLTKGQAFAGLWCGSAPPLFHSLFALFYLTKLWEAMDVLWLNLAGAPVFANVKFRRGTAPLLAWCFLARTSSHGLLCIWLNLVSQPLLYAYMSGLRYPALLATYRALSHVELFASFAAAVLSFAGQLGLLVNGFHCSLKSRGGVSIDEELTMRAYGIGIEDSADLDLFCDVIPSVLYLCYFFLLRRDIKYKLQERLKEA
eukprot:g44808.t1